MSVTVSTCVLYVPVIENHAGKLRDLGGRAETAGERFHVGNSGECLIGDKLRAHHCFRGELLQIFLLGGPRLAYRYFKYARSRTTAVREGDEYVLTGV